MNNLVENYIKNRRYLKKANVNLEYVTGDNSPYIYIDNPIIISSFAGYVKNKNPADGIYFRGEAGNHKHVVPSLFRDKGKPLTDNTIIRKKYKAYAELKASVYNNYKDKVSRFKKEDIDNLFQHYGIKSPVIDMVDNIYVAIWFAMDGNTDKFGYIRLMNTASKDLGISDLRKNHSSLSLRLHTQHGLIAKKTVSNWNKTNIYFDEYEIARIKFPVKDNIENGILFSKENIYPDIALDNTFKILKNAKWLQNRIDTLELKYGLTKGDLGSIK